MNISTEGLSHFSTSNISNSVECEAIIQLVEIVEISKSFETFEERRPEIVEQSWPVRVAIRSLAQSVLEVKDRFIEIGEISESLEACEE